MSHYFVIMVPGKGYELCDVQMETQKNGLKEKMLRKGARFSESEVEQPIVINLKYPDDVMPEMFESPLIIREDLLETILNLGIDNIDSYDCNLVNPETGKIWSNYKVCNIIGIIDVFDLDASNLHPDSPSNTAYLFNKVVLDLTKAKGHHIFRPFGRRSQIIVSEELKNCIEETGKYKHIQFIAPDDFG